MSEEEPLTFDDFVEKIKTGDLTRKLSYLAIILAAVIGTFFRIKMGNTNRLLALDPFEMYRLTEHWFTNWAPAAVDKLLFPGPGGSLSGIGYPSLTHALPAIVTKFLNLVGVSVSLKKIVILFPVLVGAFLPVTYWFLGKELYNEEVGIIAALLTFIFPQLIMIGAAGKYDTNIYIGLFFPLIMGLFIKSFNQTSYLEKIKWSLFAGIAVGLFGLFWAGYTVIFAILAFTIVLYTAIGSWIDEIQKEDTYSLIGLLIAYPILSFEHGVLSSTGILLVAPLVFLPYAAAELPSWSEKLSFVKNGITFRKIITATFTTAVFIGATLVYYGVLDIGIRGLGIVRQTAVIHSTISELQPTYGRGFGSLVSNFGTIGSLILPVLVFPLLYIAYKLYRNFNPARFLEIGFVGFTFFVHLFASRFLSLFLFTVTAAVAAEILWAVNHLGGGLKIRESLEKTYVQLTSWDKFKALIVIGILVLILFTSMPFAAPLSGDFQVQQQQSVVYQESNGAWIDTFEYLNQSQNITTEDHVLSWWDYGFAMKTLANVGAFTDNTQGNAEEAAKFYTMQNLSEGRRYLVDHMMEERGEDVDYVIGNKYIGYSGKWHAVVTVASGITDTPNLADGISPSEYEWAWGQNEVGNKTKNSNYYQLSFYNATKYNVSEEPYPGYEIVYQSPQWYIEYQPEGSQQMQIAMVQKEYAKQLIPPEQVIGPAITLYKLKK